MRPMILAAAALALTACAESAAPTRDDVLRAAGCTAAVAAAVKPIADRADLSDTDKALASASAALAVVAGSPLCAR
jgi:hypothetical protein